MNLRESRIKLNITQNELAMRSGVSIKAIQKYEQGERDIRNASGNTLKKLAEALEIRMEDFWK